MDRAQLPLGREPLQRKSSLLTTKSPEVPGTHLIDLEGWKAESIFTRNTLQILQIK